MLAVEIQNLTKCYLGKSKNTLALDNISLDVKKGSFFGLLGPNGAGKTTLINILASLVIKNSGNIKIMGQDFGKYGHDIKKYLGIVPQELILDPFFTVAEVLETYAGYYNIKKEDRKTHEIIEALGLEDKANAQPRSLSGGMRRRLLVAKALVHDPDIIILDEPTAGVDIELRSRLWDYIKKLNQDGKTIILTTHYLEEAEQLCDQIAIIDKGKIITNERKENLKKLFGDKKITIQCKKVDNNIIDKVKAFGTAEIQNNNLIISYKNSNFDYCKLLNELNKNNIEIIDLNTKESDIEDIFKNLIYK